MFVWLIFNHWILEKCCHINVNIFKKRLPIKCYNFSKISDMVPVQCAMTMYEVRPEALLSVIPSLKTVPAWTFQPIQPIKGQKGQRNWPYTTVHSFNFGLEDHFSLNNSSNQRPKRPTELALHNSPIIYFWPWRLFKLEQFASFIQLKANGIGLKQQSTHLILWYLFSFFFVWLYRIVYVWAAFLLCTEINKTEYLNLDVHY